MNFTLYNRVEWLHKLDGVGPVDNRPSTNKLHQFVKKKHVTCDMWHVTRDIWHMWHATCDLLWGMNILSKFQLPTSSDLWFMIFWRLGGKGWLSHLMSNEADCRTAPATQGLLITHIKRKFFGWSKSNLILALKVFLVLPEWKNGRRKSVFAVEIWSFVLLNTYMQ